MSNEATGLSADQMRSAIASLSSPDVIESPFGTLEFFDGVPKPETVTTIYDALDLMRGIEVFLNCVPGASLVAFRRGMASIGLTSPRHIMYTDPRANSKTLALTPNTETTYGTTSLTQAHGSARSPRSGLSAQRARDKRRDEPGAGLPSRAEHP